MNLQPLVSLYTFTILLFVLPKVQAQHSEILTDIIVSKSGGTPDSTAILDIRSQTQGVLLPRMTAFERTEIVAPETGLLVYDLDIHSLFYFDGEDWAEFGSSRKGLRDKDLDTAIKVEESLDEDIVRISTNGSERIVLNDEYFYLKSPNNQTVIGDMASGGDEVNIQNTVYGYSAGNSSFAGDHNTIIGAQSGSNLPSSSFSDNNTLIGFKTGSLLDSESDRNTIIGASAYSTSDNGNDNVIIGYSAGDLGNDDLISGNVFLGTRAGSNDFFSIVFDNVVIGRDAGRKITGSNNIMIGTNVGSGTQVTSTQGSIFIGAEPKIGAAILSWNDALWIDNTSNAEPLIRGDFANDWMNIGGKLGVNNPNPSTELSILHVNDNTKGGITLANSLNDNAWRLYTTSSTGSLRFYSTEGGNTSNDYVAYVNDATGTWNTNSDFRVKKNIKEQTSILKQVNDLNVVTYRYKRERNDGPAHIGLIAQEVDKIFPSIVDMDPEGGLYSISYAELGPIAIKAIQELAETNKTIQKKNIEMERQIAHLQTLYKQLLSKFDEHLSEHKN